MKPPRTYQPGDYLTVQEIAARTGESARTIRKLIYRTKEIPSRTKIGNARQRVVLLEDADRWFASRIEDPEETPSTPPRGVASRRGVTDMPAFFRALSGHR